MTEKEIILLTECLNQFCGILFGYKINVLSYRKIIVPTLSEPKRVMQRKLIIEESGPNIQNVYEGEK